MIEKFLVTTLGLGIVIFIYWFFFSKKSESIKASGKIDILVKGGYKPENIQIKKGHTTTLVFKRTDPSSCLEEVVIPDFKVKKYLPLGEKVEIDITPEKSGVYKIHCGMNMFHAKLIVD